jgi:hypothetical protein
VGGSDVFIEDADTNASLEVRRGSDVFIEDADTNASSELRGVKMGESAVSVSVSDVLGYGVATRLATAAGAALICSSEIPRDTAVFIIFSLRMSSPSVIRPALSTNSTVGTPVTSFLAASGVRWYTSASMLTMLARL